QAGYSCAQGYCGAKSCPATCVPFAALDAGCSGDFGEECGPGAYCAFGVCARLRVLGEVCAPNDPCAGGVCDSAQGKCTAYGSLDAGSACTVDVVCASGEYCKAGACAPRESLGGPCRLYGGPDCDAPFTCRIDAGTTGNCA